MRYTQTRTQTTTNETTQKVNIKIRSRYLKILFKERVKNNTNAQKECGRERERGGTAAQGK